MNLRSVAPWTIWAVGLPHLRTLEDGVAAWARVGALFPEARRIAEDLESDPKEDELVVQDLFRDRAARGSRAAQLAVRARAQAVEGNGRENPRKLGGGMRASRFEPFGQRVDHAEQQARDDS
jgi:hypothetical protein